MNKFSNLLVGAAILAGLAIVAPAEGGRHRGSPLEHLKSTLNLTDAQVARLQPTFDQMKQRHDAERQQFEAKMKSILTPEQQQKMAAARGEHKRTGLRDLNLSEEQKAQLKSFRTSRKGTMTQDRSQIDSQLQAVLTPEQLSKFQEMKAQRKDHRGGHGRHHGGDREQN